MGAPYVVILTVPILKSRVWGSGGSGLVVSLLCALGGGKGGGLVGGLVSG